MNRLLCALAFVSSTILAQGPVTPEAHLGRAVGCDFTLADWTEVSSYHEQLARESQCVVVESIGTTTEGRPFLLTIISDPENLVRLDDLRERSRKIADPRGLDDAAREELIAGAKPIVFLSLGMHSTETSPPQFGMEFAYDLATSDEEPYKSARRELVVVIAPCLNPDGLDHVVNWYRENVNTPFEAASLTKLYQLYCGHDNNRDWFALSQKETRIVTEQLYHRWFPQVYWDAHEQGKTRERFFVPPFRDPLDPNISPLIVTAIDELGTRALFDMTRAGMSGIATGVTYDMWWNGGNRNVPARHRIVGLLTEAASIQIGSPIFLPLSKLAAPNGLGAYAPSNRFPMPWPGGWWRLRDIIDYEHGFARSLLGSLAREPKTWLRNALAAADLDLAKARAGGPQGWLIPATNRDHGAVERLVDILLMTGVEVFRASAPFETDGRQWPAGSLVLPREQPYGEFLKDLFETQVYPEGDAPYDVAGWTLPLLFGVSRAAYVAAPTVDRVRVHTPAEATQHFLKPGFLGSKDVDPRDTHGWRAAIAALQKSESVVLARKKGQARLRLAAPEDMQGPRAEGMPRIGVIAPWHGLMNEGWLRWMMEDYDLPYISCRYEMLRAGDLHDFLDVLVVPSMRASSLVDGRDSGTVPERFAKGLGADGVAAIADFVRSGGTLVTLERSSRWAIDLFDLPIDELTRGADDFSCSGSVLRARPVKDALTYGLPEAQHLFFSNSLAFKAQDDAKGVKSLLNYAQSQLLASGWISDGEVIEGSSAWMRAKVGKGRVHLFGFRPQYRTWSHSAFHLFLRAVLFGR